MKFISKLLLALLILFAFSLLLRWAHDPLINAPQGFSANDPKYIKNQINFIFVDPDKLSKTHEDDLGFYCAFTEFKIRLIISGITIILTLIAIAYIGKSKSKLNSAPTGNPAPPSS